MFKELIIDELKSYPIVVYGMGANGKYVCQYLKTIGADIEYFCDTDVNKWGTTYEGVECKNISDISKKEKKCVIVTPLVHNREIAEQMKEIGFKKIVLWKEMQLLFRICNVNVRKIDSSLEEKLRLNKKYKDKYKGNRCFIIGTGPSIKEQTLSCLKKEIVFTVNNGIKLKDFNVLCSNFHVYIDSLYFDESDDVEHIKERVELMKGIGKETECFFPYTKAHNFIEKYKLEEFLNINYIEESSELELQEDTIDFQGRVAASGGVVVVAALLAVYMGFSEIYLLGCDCTDILTSIGAKIKDEGMTEYAYSNSKQEEKHLQNTLGQRSLETIYHIQYIKMKNFRILKEICECKGIAIYNCTKGGILDCIERKDLSEVLQIDGGR